MTLTDTYHTGATDQLRLLSDLQYHQLMSIPETVKICARFGCGKHLTIEQQLYGGRCLDHQHTERLTTIINQYI